MIRLAHRLTDRWLDRRHGRPDVHERLEAGNANRVERLIAEGALEIVVTDDGDVTLVLTRRAMS